MPLDRHARRFLEMLAAAGQAKGRYIDVAERRDALTNLADMSIRRARPRSAACATT